MSLSILVLSRCPKSIVTSREFQIKEHSRKSHLPQRKDSTLCPNPSVEFGESEATQGILNDDVITEPQCSWGTKAGHLANDLSYLYTGNNYHLIHVISCASEEDEVLCLTICLFYVTICFHYNSSHPSGTFLYYICCFCYLGLQIFRIRENCLFSLP